MLRTYQVGVKVTKARMLITGKIKGLSGEISTVAAGATEVEGASF